MSKNPALDMMKKIMKRAGNENASIISEGTIGDVTEYVDTGVYRFNAQMSGSIFKGCPENRILGFTGEPGTLKSYMSTQIAEFFLKKYEDYEHGSMVIVFETENSNSKENFEERGMDTERIMYFPVNTIEDFRNQCVKMLNEINEVEIGKAPKVLFILDSYGMLQTEKADADIEKNKNAQDMGQKAKLSSSTFGLLTMKLMKHGNTMLVPNHIYDDPNNPYVKKISGGRKYEYVCSLIFEQTTAKVWNTDKTDVLGNNVTFKTRKSRFTKPHKKSVLYIDYEKGINRYAGLLEDALEAGIFIKLGNKVLTDQEEVRKYKIIEYVSNIKKNTPLKIKKDTANFIAQSMCKSGQWLYVDRKICTNPEYFENIKLVKEYLSTTDKKRRGTLEKQFDKDGIEPAVYIDAVTEDKDIIINELKENISSEQLTTLEEYLKQDLVKMEGIVADQGIVEEDIKKHSLFSKDININPKKHFNQSVLEKLDIYLASLFNYGSRQRPEDLEIGEEDSKNDSSKATPKKVEETKE